MSDKLRELVKKWRVVAEKQRRMATPADELQYDEGHARMEGMAERTEYMADELEALLPTEPVAEPVAWAVELEDGSIGGFGWASMDTFATVQAVATLREGTRYVFAYRENTTPTEPAPDREDALTSLLREVCDELDGVGCPACIGSYSPMEDLHGRIANFIKYDAARQEQAS